ncbi:MAG: FIG00793260: hypothetical protein [uncultured Quadrisphaera sp.]|uniref:VOC domain-containing protein n=1 Tax=uncultured Quadrisphaera sp. TaxID=904978 RepID=A0A6J4PJK9_9ACTN|nr:MAG: FIG00793260: hypothetical protein [uncultured Quadrisphaera sp.]
MTTPTQVPTTSPRLVSVRLITEDVARLVAFYEQVAGVPAQWSTPDFAQVGTAVGALAIGSTRTVALAGAGAARSADALTAIIEFLVADVDAERARLDGVLTDVVMEPTTMPWGNRSLLFRDPDGTLVNLFTPVTPDAVARAGG